MIVHSLMEKIASASRENFGTFQNRGVSNWIVQKTFHGLVFQVKMML